MSPDSPRLPVAPLPVVAVRHPSVRVTKPSRSEDDDRASLPLQVLVALLAAVAITTFAIVEADGLFQGRHAAILAGQGIAIALGGWALRRRSRRWAVPPMASPLLVLLGLLPLAWEPIRRQFLGGGLPFELLTMRVLRNVILGLALLSPWRRFHSLTISLSLFLVLFSALHGSDIALRFLVGLFALGAVAWLVASHWTDVEQRLRTQQTRTRPRWGVVAAVGFAVLGILLLSGGSSPVRSSLAGFLSSSGGTGRHDRFSRDGVGDGDQLVAGSERIQSFAPIDDAPFVSDHEPSLYDVFDDTYEEEVKRPREQDRAVGLPPELAAKLKSHLQSRVEKANREFSTQRRPASTEQAAATARSIASDALFHVAGRVPLHLRLQPYDLFDGVTWYPQEEARTSPPLQITTLSGEPWLALADRSEVRTYLGPAESHAIKVVRLDANVIPAPLHTHGIHIGQVDRADMYCPGPDGLIRLDRKKLPSLVPIHLASRTVAADRIGSELSCYSVVGPVFRNIPAAAEPEAIAALAEAWTKGIPRGWSQVARIQDRLKTEYRLDPAARPSEDALSPVHDFLFHSRCGPDYQFATAAALLLRSLGYSTRLVSGFYANPAHYDADARHTPVLAEDAHVWAEVNVAGGDWLTVEAAPGYEVLAPPPSLWQQAQAAASRVAGVAVRNAVPLAAVALLLVGAFWNRQGLADRLDTLRWRLAPRRDAAAHLLATLHLIERRGARTGFARPTGATASRWLIENLSRRAPEISAELRLLQRGIDEAVYCRGGLGPVSDELREASGRVARTLSQSWFRGQSGPRPRPTSPTGPHRTTEVL
ncbi:transglutaminase-like domain-containing protein [Planctomyces sp. SH-PL14]|uniref:transglutaminase-like domain-containing protein n=1 Tax=Planctomyces sp. SH-PL14 TaxID=1632864 RepID=UPI00078E5990|nr:transglutaminase-like domain-containing protein [Planctomyces sp. SH-PL14]AMV18290.1 Transglutaminase-like superfamily protein [Planctomyces sp. SH-PL14]